MINDTKARTRAISQANTKAIVFLYPPKEVHTTKVGIGAASHTPFPVPSFPSLQATSLLEIKRAILNCCKKDGITVTQVITAKDAYDYDALLELITAVRDHKEQQDQKDQKAQDAQDSSESAPITLVINRVFRTSFDYIPLWCVLATLNIVGLINDIRVYNRWHIISNVSKKEIGGLKKNNFDLLAESLAYFQDKEKEAA